MNPKEDMKRMDIVSENIADTIKSLFKTKNYDITVAISDEMKDGAKNCHITVQDLSDDLIYTDKQVAMLIDDIGFSKDDATYEQFEQINTFMKEHFQREPFNCIVEHERLMKKFKEYCFQKADYYEKIVNDMFEGKHLIHSTDHFISELNMFSKVDSDLLDSYDFDIMNDIEQCEMELREISEDDWYYDFEDEKANLNKVIDGDIAVIAERGLWNGNYTNIGFVSGHNLNDCLDCPGSFDSWSVYVDEEGNLVGEGHHHDGTNYYTFYECDKEAVEDAIEKGKDVMHLLKPMGHYVAEIYGFELKKPALDKTINECEEKNDENSRYSEIHKKDKETQMIYINEKPYYLSFDFDGGSGGEYKKWHNFFAESVKKPKEDFYEIQICQEFGQDPGFSIEIFEKDEDGEYTGGEWKDLNEVVKDSDEIIAIENTLIKWSDKIIEQSKEKNKDDIEL